MQIVSLVLGAPGWVEGGPGCFFASQKLQTLFPSLSLLIFATGSLGGSCGVKWKGKVAVLMRGV